MLLLHTPTKVGEQTHINHDGCPAGQDNKRRLYIKREHDCILAYCHHCHGHLVYRDRDIRSLENIEAALLNSYDNPTNTAVLLPDDIEGDVSQWPLAERAWLANYPALTQGVVDAEGMCYSPSLGRIIVPYFNEEGVLVFWQGRDCSIAPTLKWMMAKSATKPLGFYPNTIVPAAYSRFIIVVEDPISAITIANTTEYDALCLYGTVMSDAQVEFIVNRGKRQNHYLWLDPDTAGRTGAADIKRKLDTVCCSSCATVVVKGLPQPKDTPLETLQKLKL